MPLAEWPTQEFNLFKPLLFFVVDLILPFSFLVSSPPIHLPSSLILNSIINQMPPKPDPVRRITRSAKANVPKNIPLPPTRNPPTRRKAKSTVLGKEHADLVHKFLSFIACLLLLILLT